MSKTSDTEREFMKIAKSYFILLGYGTSGELSKHLVGAGFGYKNQNYSPNKVGNLLCKRKKHYRFMDDIGYMRLSETGRRVWYYKPFKEVVRRECNCISE